MKTKRQVVMSGMAVAIVLILGGLWVTAQETDPTDGRAAYQFEEIADGVYFATGTGAMTTFSNSLVIVNDDHAMLVDTSVSPAAARKLVAEIKTEVTDKPIRYVFNTHFHCDHAHGNQIFGDDVEILGHEYVRDQHLSNVLDQRTNRSFSEIIPGQIEQLEEAISAAVDSDERARLQVQLRVSEAHWNAIQETDPKAPNVTYRDMMKVVKGGREVQLHFVGRGHTAGDTMVFLPEERIVFTGDFFVGQPGAAALPFMGDGFVNEWPASLQRLKGLDFDVIVPGHGRPFREREQIETLQSYLRDFWQQVSDFRAEGLSVDQAVARVDMSDHASVYGEGVRNVDPRAVTRIYEVLQILHPM